MTVAGDPQTPLPPLKKKASPPSKYCLQLDRRARRGRLSPRSTRDGSVRTREQAWDPTASSPDSASTRRSLSLAPARDALHTLISCHAPTTPLCSATRAQTSGREVARSTAQLARSSASVVRDAMGADCVGGLCERGGVDFCVCRCFLRYCKKSSQKAHNK
jgi:hypothetical protein